MKNQETMMDLMVRGEGPERPEMSTTYACSIDHGYITAKGSEMISPTSLQKPMYCLADKPQSIIKVIKSSQQQPP
jgi:hypothetical protein